MQVKKKHILHKIYCLIISKDRMEKCVLKINMYDQDFQLKILSICKTCKIAPFEVRTEMRVDHV